MGFLFGVVEEYASWAYNEEAEMGKNVSIDKTEEA